MSNMDKAEIDDLIAIIERQIMKLDVTLFNANRKLDDLHRSVERLKTLRDSKQFEQQKSFDSVPELHSFFESLPHSVHGRVIALTKELKDTGEELLARLCTEARALLLYDAIYAEVDAMHDLHNGMLSRVIRDCIDHEGHLPSGANRDVLLFKCPKILIAIESAYQNNLFRNPKSYLES